MALSYVTLDFGALNQVTTARRMGHVPVVNLGWYTWGFGTHESEIKPINFQQSILFCPFPNASGINIYMTNQLPYAYKLYGKDGTALGVDVGGKALNLATGILTGWGFPNSWGPAGWQGSKNFSIEIPYSNAPRTIGLTPSKFVGLPQGSGGVALSTYRPYMLMLQYASEIAQWTVMRDDNMATQTFASLQGENFINQPGGIARQCQVDLTAAPTDNAYKFGKTGLYKAGYFAYEYNGFYGPLQYINQISQTFFPPAPLATGARLWLPDGIAANATLGYFTDYQQAMSTTLGNIGLMSGELAGLL